MQRAAASNATKDGSSDAGEGSHTPKRRRVSTEKSSPATPQSDLEAISAAIAAEEEKRRSAIARQAAEAGETEWVLNVPESAPAPPRPVVTAAESLDTDSIASSGGRRAFGGFKRKPTAVCFFGSLLPNLYRQLIFEQAEEASRISKEKAEANDEKEKSKPQKIKTLAKMTSISSGGGSGGGGSSQDALKKKKKRQSQGPSS